MDCSGTVLDDIPPWLPIIGDQSQSHTIAFPDTLRADIFGQPIENGDYIGVFFSSDTGLVNGGALKWNSNQDGDFQFLQAYTDHPDTPEKDGFITDENFIFKVWKANSQTEHFTTANYLPENAVSQGLPNAEEKFIASQDVVFSVVDALATFGEVK